MRIRDNSFQFGLASLFLVVTGVCVVFAVVQFRHRSHFALTREYEQQIEAKIVHLLGIEGLRVAVSAVFSEEMRAERATASIQVPRSHVLSLWRVDHDSGPTLEEFEYERDACIAEIEDAVFPLLPPPVDGEDAYPRVRVETYDDRLLDASNGEFDRS